MEVVVSAPVEWTKSLFSTLQNTRDIKYLDLRGMRRNRDSTCQILKNPAGQAGPCLLSAWLAEVLWESEEGEVIVKACQIGICFRWQLISTVRQLYPQNTWPQEAQPSAFQQWR